MTKINIFKFDFIPQAQSYERILEAMLGEPLIMHYDFSSQDAFAIANGNEQLNSLHNIASGIKISAAEHPDEMAIKDALLLKPYYMAAYKSTDMHVQKPISDIYEIMRGEDARMAVAFVPSNIKHARVVKERIEEELSRGELRLTKSGNLRSKQGISIFSGSTNSTQAQLYYNSGERMVMESMLSMLNEILLSNGISYKVLILAEDNQKLLRYISQKLMILEDSRMTLDTIAKFYDKMWRIDSLPFSIDKAAQFLVFPDKIVGGINIKTKFEPEQGSICIGTFMRDSLEDSGERISVYPDTFNLGTIITGLPGTGKTLEAMSIVRQVCNTEPRPQIAIIAPTEEWGNFALENNLRLVKLYESDMKINFFKCDAKIGIEKFYENLSMLIAFASNAGPYKNSLEKCLLAAFHKAYASTKAPDPVEVYEAIEEAVIEQHGKRTNVGVKYTKHGENIRAALENLRLMLFREEFSAKEGIDFGSLLEDGVVFDLSKVSNNMKAFFYALILNQIYSFADSFDIIGDKKLRMLVCLEESQLVFNADEFSATTADLRQRIQDFRKRGIGLMLVAHSITDINQSIRRLCQNKLYFRQSSDVTKYAAMDLGFREMELENVIDKLKTIEQRVCAFSHVSRKGAIATSPGPIFITTVEYVEGSAVDYKDESNAKANIKDSIKLKLVDGSGNAMGGIAAKLIYVGENVAAGKTDENGEIRFSGILIDRIHTLNIYSQKNRFQTFRIVAKDQTIIVPPLRT